MNKKLHFISIASFVVFIVLGLACATAPNSRKFDNFHDNPNFRGQFIGTWRNDPQSNGHYGVATYNEDGTSTETVYDRNNNVVMTVSGQFKTSSNQKVYLVGGNAVVFNYNFLDSNTFTIRGSGHSFTYRRVGGNVQNNWTAVTGIEGALERAATEIAVNINARSTIAIVYITAPETGVAEYISGELEHILLRNGFIIIDRSELDRIRSEQRLGLSGEVDDNTAARIGNIAGAGIVITGRVDGDGALRRLRLRALDTSTARVIGTASERI